MRRLRSFRGLSSTVFMAVATLVGGCISTATYGTGESPEIAIFREIAGGLGANKDEPIEYQPRAPLVLPPTATAEALPPPVETAAVAAADWPQEPAESEPVDFDNPERAVSPEYAERLAPLAGLAPASPDRDSNGDENPNYDVIGKKEQLSAFRAAVDAENTTGAMGADGRQFLTQPPDTYLEPAATAPTEFEDIEKKKKGGFLCVTCWF